MEPMSLEQAKERMYVIEMDSEEVAVMNDALFLSGLTDMETGNGTSWTVLDHCRDQGFRLVKTAIMYETANTPAWPDGTKRWESDAPTSQPESRGE